jgi:hypothetical protein
MGITGPNDPKFYDALLQLGILQQFPPGPNLVEEQARRMTEYLTRFDADGGTTVIYWATGNGRQIEVVGDLTEADCTTTSFPNPREFGNETHLLPAVKYFVDRFNDAPSGIYIFITDGALHDLEEVKRYTIQLARDIARGKRNELKFVLIGVGDEVDEDQMEQLDDLNAERDLWDHKIASNMNQLAEIFTEMVGEAIIMIPGDGVVKDPNGNVVRSYRDTGLPALLWFDLPTGVQAFTLEVAGQVVNQPLTAGVQFPGVRPASPATSSPKPATATVDCIECRRPIPVGTKICPHCNTSQDLPVAQPAPLTPSALVQLVATPAQLDFGSVASTRSDLPSLELRVRNDGQGAWRGAVRSTLPWLEVIPSALDCPAGGEVVLAVKLTPASTRLRPRLYNAPDALVIEGEGQILQVGAQVDTR